MSKRGKKIAVEGVASDLISNLPSEVINHILDYLTVRDVAKTSVLSRKWRHIWASNPNINISYDTVDTPVTKKRKKGWSLNGLSSVVSKILLQHIGPVLKFSLEIPLCPSTNSFDFSFFDHWLSYLSRNGIRELTLKTREPCVLPSHVFSAPELLVLNLSSFIFNSPNGHADFRKLTILNLCNIHFWLSRVPPTIFTPELTFLSFKSCKKFCNVKITAPKLKTLVLERNENVDLIGFEMPEITTVALMGFQIISLTNLFERCRKISSLYVDGLPLRFMVSDVQMETRQLKTISLKHLVLSVINWGDLFQISRILYFLRNSTSLTRLEISNRGTRRDLRNELSNYLDAAHSMNWTINNLEIVIIDNTCGAEDEVSFIQFLLSRAPRLKRMFVREKMLSDDNGNLNLAKRLMRFPRASTEADIIFEPNVRAAKILEVSSLI